MRRTTLEVLLAAWLLAALAGCAASPSPPEPAPRPEPVSRRPVAEPVAAPAPVVDEPERAARPTREVREVVARPPAIDVLAAYTPRRNRFTRDNPPEVTVLGADLEAGEVLLREWQWIGYARSADSVEVLTALDLAKARPRRILRAAGLEEASGRDVLGLGSYTGSFAGDLRRIVEAMARFGAPYWGREVLVLSEEQEKVVVFDPRSRDLLLTDLRGRRISKLRGDGVGDWMDPAAPSPDGASAAVVCPLGDCLLVVDLETGATRQTPMESASNPVWVDPATLYVATYRDVDTTGRDYSFQGCLRRVRTEATLEVEEVFCLPALIHRHPLFADPARETGVMLVPSQDRTTRGAELGVLWFRLADGAILAERALPPYSEVELVADGPLLISSHDPDIMDGAGRTDSVLTVVELASGRRLELERALVGGHLRGLHRAERDGEEQLLSVRQPDDEVPRFEVVRIDPASAFPEE